MDNNEKDCKTEEEKSKKSLTKEDNYAVEILGEQYKEYDMSFKLIVIGNSGVGKSCLSLKATKGVFEEAFVTTVGFEFFTLTLRIDDKRIKLQIWDTCGQEVYRSLISSFYRNSSLAMMVYSIDRYIQNIIYVL